MATNTATIEQRTLALLASLDWQTRVNDMDNDVQIKPGPHEDWEYITANLSCHFRNEARKHGVFEVNAAFDALISTARKNHYHPVKNYLAGLSYEGNQNIRQLAECFLNPDDMLETFLRRWLVGAARRVIEGGTQNRMLVLVGPQGCGKSKFVEWLVPQPLRRSHYRSSPIDPTNEDHRRWLLKTWVWEVGELGATTRRADVEGLKHFLTLEQVSIRLKYDRGDTEKPSMCSFIGTLNPNGNGVLNDRSGNRRFMFCNVTAIDWERYTRCLDVNQVWAEAVMLYLAGESADLTPDESAKASAINTEYQVESPVQDLILQYFDLDPTNKNWFTWTVDIEALLQDPPLLQNLSTPRPAYKGSQDKLRKDIGEILMSMGCEKGSKRKPGNNQPQKGYYGIQQK